MADLVEVSFSSAGTLIGTAFNGIFETMPGKTALGLSKIRWISSNPKAYEGALCEVEGTFVDFGRGQFLNDMTLVKISESAGTAEFQALT